MKCDIILPVCDQFEFTKNCIDSIMRRTDTPYRLIVINNGTNEKTKAYLAEVKKILGDGLVVVRNDTNIGWVKALNQGIAISDAPYLCFQNDDTVVTQGWLGKMIKILAENEGIGLVNPAWEGRPEYVSIDDYGARIEKRHGGRFIETDWARGFCVVMKKEVVDKIGKVDEIFGLAYFDDVDYSVRAVNAGFLVVLALDTYVYHHRNVTFFEVLKGKRWNELHEKNKIIYYRRHGRPLKISLILDRRHLEDKDRFQKLKGTVYHLARKQHHVDIWSPAGSGSNFLHTNIRFIRRPQPFIYLSALAGLWLNSGKKPAKRYNAVFSYDWRFGGLLKRAPFLKDTPLYAAVPGEDFDDAVRKTADDIKEKTKMEKYD